MTCENYDDGDDPSSRPLKRWEVALDLRKSEMAAEFAAIRKMVDRELKAAHERWFTAQEMRDTLNKDAHAALRRDIDAVAAGDNSFLRKSLLEAGWTPPCFAAGGADNPDISLWGPPAHLLPGNVLLHPDLPPADTKWKFAPPPADQWRDAQRVVDSLRESLLNAPPEDHIVVSRPTVQALLDLAKRCVSACLCPEQFKTLVTAVEGAREGKLVTGSG